MTFRSAVAARTAVRRSAPLPPARHVLVYLVLTLGAAAMLYPLVNLVLMSFKTLANMAADPIGLPHQWMLSNYATAWQEGDLGRYLVNSVLVGGATVFCVLLFSSLGAYVLSRFEFGGNNFLYLLFLAGLALPVQLIAVPLFIVMAQLGLINDLASVVIVYVASGMSFSVFLLVNYFRTLPVELDEAAKIEGASALQVYRHVILPLSRPGLTTVGVIQFVGAWNALFFPLIFLSDHDQMTVTIGVLSFIGQYSTAWDLLLPALVIVMLPTIFAFGFASRQFARGLTAGAVR